MLWASLPDLPDKEVDLGYFGILWTMLRFAVTEPVLIQSCLMSVCTQAGVLQLPKFVSKRFTKAKQCSVLFGQQCLFFWRLALTSIMSM